MEDMPYELLVYFMSRSKTNMLSAVQTIRTTVHVFKCLQQTYLEIITISIHFLKIIICTIIL